MSEFYLKKPLLVTGIPTSPSPTLWSVKTLVENYGNVAINVGSSRTLTKSSGSGHASALLKDFVSTVKSHHAAERNLDAYAFDRDSKIFETDPKLIEQLRKTAAQVFGQQYDLSLDQKKSKYHHYFSLGAKGSGVHLHHHGDGWSYLFEGNKRWFFRPPYTLPSGTQRKLL